MGREAGQERHDPQPDLLHASAAGGMALQASVAERWRELTGTPIVEGYGLTESSPVLTFNLLTGLAKDGTIGIPVPSTEVKCVDENGNEVTIGESGEIGDPAFGLYPRKIPFQHFLYRG